MSNDPDIHRNQLARRIAGLGTRPKLNLTGSSGETGTDKETAVRTLPLIDPGDIDKVLTVIENGDGDFEASWETGGGGGGSALTVKLGASTLDAAVDTIVFNDTGFAAVESPDHTITVSLDAHTHTIQGALNFVVKESEVITVEAKGAIWVPFDFSITDWYLVGDKSGSIVVDVWASSNANWPLSDTYRVAGTGKPTISSAYKANGNVSAWLTTTFTGGTWIQIEVESVTSITNFTCALGFTRVIS